MQGVATKWRYNHVRLNRRSRRERKQRCYLVHLDTFALSKPLSQAWREFTNKFPSVTRTIAGRWDT